jgi:hypothetical protein
MNNSSGFYSLNNNEIVFVRNSILVPGVEISRENKDNYQYPMLGWYWFDSDEAAAAFFNLNSEN